MLRGALRGSSSFVVLGIDYAARAREELASWRGKDIPNESVRPQGEVWIVREHSNRAAW